MKFQFKIKTIIFDSLSKKMIHKIFEAKIKTQQRLKFKKIFFIKIIDCDQIKINNKMVRQLS